jgi:aminotransferase EvaB
MLNSEQIIPINDLSRRFANDSDLMNQIWNLVVNGPYFKSKFTAKFESEFANYIGTIHCTTVSSGTSALELAFRALQLPYGSQVLMAANAGGYSAIAAKRAGLKPLFLEVNENGLIDIKTTTGPLNNVSAIVATHLYGQRCDMESIQEFARVHDLRIVEDCAQAVGCNLNGKAAGSYGDVSAFSFYPTKNLGAIGDAGAICTNSEAINSRVVALREYGWSQRYLSQLEGGANFRMDELQAIVLLNQLKNLERNNLNRLKIWRQYREICFKHKVQIFGSESKGFSPHLAVLRLENRERFIEFMRENKIDVAIHYPYPDFDQPGIDSTRSVILPRTTTICSQVVSIPLFPEMTQHEVSRVKIALSEYFENVL